MTTLKSIDFKVKSHKLSETVMGGSRVKQELISFSKDEIVAILKANYLIFRDTEDTVYTLEIDQVNMED